MPLWCVQLYHHTTYWVHLVISIVFAVVTKTSRIECTDLRLLHMFGMAIAHTPGMGFIYLRMVSCHLVYDISCVMRKTQSGCVGENGILRRNTLARAWGQLIGTKNWYPVSATFQATQAAPVATGYRSLVLATLPTQPRTHVCRLWLCFRVY